MVNAQQWLDENYPKNDTCKTETNDYRVLWNNEKEKGEVKMLEEWISWLKGEGGELIIEPYKSELKVCKELLAERITKGWNNRGKRREEIIKLDISEKKLEGELILKGFTNLKQLNCSGNQLTNLDLSGCPNLEELNCINNELVSLDLSNCPKLKRLDCYYNKLKEKDSIKFAPECEELRPERLNIYDPNYKYYQEHGHYEGLSLDHTVGYEGGPSSSKYDKEILYPAGPSSSKNYEKRHNRPDEKKRSKEKISSGEYNEIEISLDDLDGMFMKYLPTLVKKNEIEKIENEVFQQLINEKHKFSGEIVDTQFFSTWWNPNCALVINKVFWHTLHLVIYEPALKDQDRKEIFQPEIFKVFKLTGDLENLSYEEALKKSEELKQQLNSDNPILAVYSDTGFSRGNIIEKTELPKDAQDYPERYLEPGDMVWRPLKGLPVAQHVAIYLGNERVVHISHSKFVKFNGVSETSKAMEARSDHWKDFLALDLKDKEFRKLHKRIEALQNHKEIREKDKLKLIRNRLLIPFQRPEEIQKNLIRAVLSNYGKKEYSFLGKNCEHFATLCITGIPFSTQADWLVFFKFFPKNLVKAIQENNEEFDRKVTPEQIKAAINLFSENREKRQATERDRSKLLQYQAEINNLKKLISQIEISPKS